MTQLWLVRTLAQITDPLFRFFGVSLDSVTVSDGSTSYNLRRSDTVPITSNRRAENCGIGAKSLIMRIKSRLKSRGEKDINLSPTLIQDKFDWITVLR